jgi:hypothetical protein
VLYALLGHAVSTAASVEDARRIVEGFVDEFGLLATAEVLAYKVALASIDPAKLIEASQSVRAQVIESCRHDLVSDLRAEQPDALTNLHFGRYLDEALIGELSVFAKNSLRTAKRKPMNSLAAS